MLPRVGSTQLCVRQPTAANSIDPEQMARYVVSVEVLDSNSDTGPSASDDALVLLKLFGPYLA